MSDIYYYRYMAHLNNHERRHQFYRALEAKSLLSRTPLIQISDELTNIASTPTFFIFHIFFFTAWILINSGKVAFIEPFDPYPYGFLTMVVSLEAIFLSIFVLISQARAAHIATLREEVNLRIAQITEEEVTKALELLAKISKKLDIRDKDEELDRMLQRLNTYYIEESISKQLQKANKPVWQELIKEFPDLLISPVKKAAETITAENKAP